MTCEHTPNYDHACDICIARKLVMLRSADKQLTMKLQKGVMGEISRARQERVKEILRGMGK